MRTGDVILSTSEGYTSFIVRNATRSAWSHCAAVIWLDKNGLVQLEYRPGYLLCLLDIGGSITFDQKTKQYTAALRIVRYHEAILTYTKIGHCRLSEKVRHDQYFLARTREFVNKYVNGQIVFDQFRAASAWLNDLGPEELTSNGVYCSEVMALYLQKVVWPSIPGTKPTFPTGMVTPHTFTQLPEIYDYPQFIYHHPSNSAEDKLFLCLLLAIVVFLVLVTLFYYPRNPWTGQ